MAGVDLDAMGNMCYPDQRIHRPEFDFSSISTLLCDLGKLFSLPVLHFLSSVNRDGLKRSDFSWYKCLENAGNQVNT